MTAATTKILDAVRDERFRQEKLWGSQSAANIDSLLLGLAILAEEVGEANHEIIEAQGNVTTDQVRKRLLLAKIELIQVSAVAAALAENIDQRLG